MFNNVMQHDAHEFLNYLLNALSEQSATLSLDQISFIQRLFQGTLSNETKCLLCETITHRDEQFLDLSIDIQPQSSVTACLRAFSHSELMDGKNKFYCDACGSYQEAEKRYFFVYV
jgi:ubiquitin C-terminal hydrolase